MYIITLKLEKNFIVATVHKKTPHSFECGVSIITAKYARYHTLISTSTPLGSSNFIRASTVLEEEE